MSEQVPLWIPDSERRNASFMQQYLNWLKANYGLTFADYAALHSWSIQHLDDFWGSFWSFAGIISHQPWTDVLHRRPGMIGTSWFEGATLNYAEHIFRNRSLASPAICTMNEGGEEHVLLWEELEKAVAILAAWLKQKGIRKGDVIASVLPNIAETVIAFLACQSIGAIWSSCSPDFGTSAVLDRFSQIHPKVLVVSDGYRYNGKEYAKMDDWDRLADQLPSLNVTVIVDKIGKADERRGTLWTTIMSGPAAPLTFEPLAFHHPIWILYSSGTTGKPKAIVHSVGGNLIEHLKVLLLHWDVKPGERFFWYSTTGWMMWNFSLASLLVGATLMLYDGSPVWPEAGRLWDWAENKQIHHFGSGAAYFIGMMKDGDHWKRRQLTHLRSIGSTGSPLPAECFEWIYREVSPQVWLISFSGGTDICSGFVGGCPLLPLYKGEIQCALLGVALEAWDEDGRPVIGRMGELIIREPMPSMPLCFWDDKDNARYKESYFSMFPGVWRHGDWIEVTPRGGIVIYGRSDTTLNRDGVRIGTSEIYAVLDRITEVEDSLVVCIEQKDGSFYMPLFVKLNAGQILSEVLLLKIRKALKEKASPRHVPDKVLIVKDIPYTISGKKMEASVKKILLGMSPEAIGSKEIMRNPEALDQFSAFNSGN